MTFHPCARVVLTVYLLHSFIARSNTPLVRYAVSCCIIAFSKVTLGSTNACYVCYLTVDYHGYPTYPNKNNNNN